VVDIAAKVVIEATGDTEAVTVVFEMDHHDGGPMATGANTQIEMRNEIRIEIPNETKLAQRETVTSHWKTNWWRGLDYWKCIQMDTVSSAVPKIHIPANAPIRSYRER
jgi:hypothetical protein